MGGQRRKHLSVLEDIKKGVSLEVIVGLSFKGLAEIHQLDQGINDVNDHESDGQRLNNI